MTEPKNKTERKLFREACEASYRQEIKELKENFGLSNLNHIYFSDHLGMWVVSYLNGDFDDTFDSKREAIEWLINEAGD